MQFADFAEMVTVNGQGHGQRKQSRPTKERPEQELPIMDPFLTDDPQAKDRTKEGQNILHLHGGSNFGRFVLLQKGFDSPIVMLRRVNVLQDILGSLVPYAV